MWRVVYQRVVPAVYGKDIMAIAHETPMSCHLGVSKTCHKILSQFLID